MIVKVLNEDAGHDYLDIMDIEFMVYDYTAEMYEGYGNALFYKEGKWFTHNMGHCSCYDPFEELNLEEPFDTLEEAMVDLYDKDWSKSFNKEILAMNREAMIFLQIQKFALSRLGVPEYLVSSRRVDNDE